MHPPKMRRIVALSLVFAGLLLAGGCPTTAYRIKPKLAPEPEQRTIVMLNPDIELSILHVGGVNEPHAEWTRAGQRNVAQALRDRFRASRIQMVDPGEAANGPDIDQKETQLFKLHNAVGQSILVHQYAARPLTLPTKQKEGGFDWSLGREVKYLRDKYGARYGLFTFVRDSYATDERKAMIFMAALLFGAHVPGGVQIAYASLVDLETGEVVWFNVLARAEGDLRNMAGARETVNKLLTEFPL